MMKKIVICLLMALGLSQFFVLSVFASEQTEPLLRSPLTEQTQTQKQHVVWEKEDELDDYIVFLLDTSYTMRGNSTNESRKLVAKFIAEANLAKQNQHIAIVSFNDSGQIIQPFTQNSEEVIESLKLLRNQGKTNLTDGLKKAEELFSTVPENTKKHILLVTDRTTTTGETFDSPYNRKDIYSYKFANAADKQTNKLKELDVSIRTFLFFDKLVNTTKPFALRFFNNLQTHGLFDFKTADLIDFTFHRVEDKQKFISGTFSYGSSMGNRDAISNFHYSDSYFEESSYAYQENENQPYNPSLATMSLNLELSAFNSTTGVDYVDKSGNVRELFSKIGFGEFRVNAGFTQQPTKDSIGAAIAQKKIVANGKEYTLIGLAIRGGGYEAEWASNLTLGNNGEHQGFSQAKDEILRFLDDYIRQTDVKSDVKLWITGYSRGSAVANLTAGALNNGRKLAQGNLKPEDMYAFCFEVPAGAVEESNARDDLHNNIINIINLNDIVTKVAPRVKPFGFVRYGRDVTLPEKAITSPSTYKPALSNMLKELEKIESASEYILDDFRLKDAIFVSDVPVYVVEERQDEFHSMKDFLDDFIDTIATKHIGNRTKYTLKYQTDLRELAAVVLGTSDKNKDAFFTKLFTNAAISYSLPYGTGFLLQNVKKDLIELLNSLGITNYSDIQIESMLATFLDLIASYAFFNFDDFITIDSNLEKIKAAHYPELCLAWLRSMDKNYTDNEIIYPEKNDKYLKLFVQGDIDITITNEYVDTVTTSIINKPAEFILPIETNYQLNIRANKNTVVNFTIQTIDSETNAVLLTEEYNDIEIEENGQLIGKINNNENTLSRQTVGNKLRHGDTLPKIVVENSSEDYYSTNLETEGKLYGHAIGGGSVQYANYAEFHAFEFENGKFVGWFKNDVMLSTQKDYYHKVTDESTIIAKFEEKTNENN